MKPSQIEATFLQPHPLPHPLVEICHYLDRHGYPISGCFELSSIGVDDLAIWFRHQPQAAESFLPFGRGASGDVYALWLTGGLSAEDAPVVMFGSEGQLQVLATDPEQFCRLLCLGYSEIGYDDASKPPSRFEETAPFRAAMVKRFGFEVPETGQPIVAAAQSRFPDFRSWVESRQV